MSRTTAGTDNATPSQTRRVMSRHSGDGPVSAVTMTGSSAGPSGSVRGTSGVSPSPGLSSRMSAQRRSTLLTCCQVPFRVGHRVVRARPELQPGGEGRPVAAVPAPAMDLCKAAQGHVGHQLLTP